MVERLKAAAGASGNCIRPLPSVSGPDGSDEGSLSEVGAFRYRVLSGAGHWLHTDNGPGLHEMMLDAMLPLAEMP